MNGKRLLPLGEVLRRAPGWAEVDPRRTYKELTVRLWGRGVVLRREVPGAAIGGRKRRRAGGGQFILSRIDARHGAFGLVPPELAGALVSQDFPLFDVDESRLLPAYLGWWSRSPEFAALCRQASEGTTNRVRLKEEKLLAARILLPPLPEQRRIVERLERVAARLDEAHGLRRRSRQEVAALVAAALGAAYGEAAASGVGRLGDLCRRITDGCHRTPVYVPDGVPFLSVKDVSSGAIRFDEAKFITREQHADLVRRCRPEPGDVLLTKIGTTGLAKVIDVEREFSIFVSLALLKLDRRRLEPKFAEYMLNSPPLKARSKDGTRGVGNQNLVLKCIREFPMPAPSLAEQRRIVTDLDRLHARVGEIEALQRTTAAEMEALLPSLLELTFRGELRL
jgi:type I restriction enzyme, S subunit